MRVHADLRARAPIASDPRRAETTAHRRALVRAGYVLYDAVVSRERGDRDGARARAAELRDGAPSDVERASRTRPEDLR